ncbi:MAG: tyrosine protein phosphatase [Isosphaeraceae bacterium]
MTTRYAWVCRGFAICVLLLGAEQTWRHGHDYVFAREFAVVEPGKIYRGAWQKDWPMRRIVSDCKIRTILALAHPDDHPLSVSERALAEELGIRWIHIPIVDQRSAASPKTLSDLLDEAAGVLANPKNYPIFFHCHHGLNRASMVQIAYRTKYCGWTLDEATDEVAKTVGLVKVTHGPDYRHMVDYYNSRVLPFRNTNSNLQIGYETPAEVAVQATAPTVSSSSVIR